MICWIQVGGHIKLTPSNDVGGRIFVVVVDGKLQWLWLDCGFYTSQAKLNYEVEPFYFN